MVVVVVCWVKREMRVGVDGYVLWLLLYVCHFIGSVAVANVVVCVVVNIIVAVVVNDVVVAISVVAIAVVAIVVDNFDLK